MLSEDSSVVNDACRPIGLRDVTWQRSRRKTKTLASCDLRFCQTSYTMFTRCDRRGDRSQLQLWLQLSCDSGWFHPVCDRPRDCRTDYTNWSQSHRPAKCRDTWNVEGTLKLTEIVKYRSLANRPQRIRKEGTAGHWTLLCIGYTSVAQCARTVVLFCDPHKCGTLRPWNAESDKGYFAERSALDFPQITPLTFRILYSTKYLCPSMACSAKGLCTQPLCQDISLSQEQPSH